MRIGSYKIYDWKLEDIIWVRKIHSITSPISIHDIMLVPLKDLQDSQFVEIEFIDKFPSTEYHLMFGDKIEFSNLNSAKQRVDLFLDKLSRLKAFL
jgi:hypothetical protein